MDELSLLRRIRTDTPEPEQAAVDRGRAALLERARSEGRSDADVAAKKRRYPVRWAGIGALGAGALTVALVATNILGFGDWRGGADAAAADALNAAALAAIKNSDAEVGTGQYLLVETDAVYGNTVQNDAGDSISYLTINRDKLYIPANHSDEWVWVRSFREPYRVFDERDAVLADQRYRDEVNRAGGVPELLRAPHARFYGDSTLPDHDSLPRDPQQLLDHIYKVTAGAGQSADGAALAWIADTLRTGVARADLRAALYQAVAGIPGVEITEASANLEGRVGVAVGRVETADDSRQDIIIDTETGALIGERRVTMSEGWGYPAGTTTSFTAVRTTVVDAAPTTSAQNGGSTLKSCVEVGDGRFEC